MSAKELNAALDYACEILSKDQECPLPDYNMWMDGEEAAVALSCCLEERCDNNCKECWKRFLLAKTSRK